MKGRQMGKLTVQVSSGAIPEDVDDVFIRFIDTGTGIPPEHLENIWDAFFTTKPEGKGTGLGLAICRRVAEEHQGTIAIDSETGIGTTVMIALPVMQQGADS
jgi:two-component system, LuxR family, sensor kinase FixL